MTDKKRIACFFTGGYTELNAMKGFVRRINDNVEYRQLCPIAPRKSRTQIRKRIKIEGSQNGLTGESLMEFVINTVDKTYFTRESYDAILIEDDRDERFLNKNTETICLERWKEFKCCIQKKLNQKGVTVPVIILLAAPKVEAWFISDWDNGFGQIHKNISNLNTSQKGYFSVVFRKFIENEIITDQYSSDKIEAYGYFNGKYKKLSEEIQKALDEKDFLSNYIPPFEHELIRYSKRRHGEDMLENIDPNTVLKSCRVFFREAFEELKKI